MKNYTILFILFFSASCTSVKAVKPNAAIKISKTSPVYDELAVTLDHLKAVINSLKGIETSTKERSIKLTEEAFDRFKELRAEELNILKTLISKSVRYKDLTKEDVRSKDYHIKRLDAVYREKEMNVLRIINALKKISNRQNESDELEVEMLNYLKPIL